LSKTDYLTTFEIREIGEHAAANQPEEAASNLASVVAPYLKDAIEKKKKTSTKICTGSGQIRF
jgi:hypothetical protein